MTFHFILRPTCALAALLLVSCAATRSKRKDFLTSYDGFTQDSTFDNRTTYRGDLAKLPAYKGVFIEEVKVVPAEGGSGEKITPEDVSRLERSFRDAIEDEIGESRFTLAPGKARGVLSFRALLTNLQPGNPALFAVGYVPYLGTAMSATRVATGEKLGSGAATIEAELIDSLTRERFFAIIDENTGSKLNPLGGLDRWAHIDSAFKQWAHALRMTLAGEAEKRPRGSIARKGPGRP